MNGHVQVGRSVADSIVRGWVLVYTWGLPAERRDNRRLEIESDLWEQRNDDSGSEVVGSAAVLGRWLRGVPSDLMWRAEAPGVSWLTAAVFAVCAAVGMQMGLLAPGIPEFDSSPSDMAEFYEGKELAIILGHGLIFLSLLFFARVVADLRAAFVDASAGKGLSVIVAVSGLVTIVLVGLVFGLTLVAAFLGRSAHDTHLLSTLYPMAGFIFHVVLSVPIVMFLAATSAAVLRSATAPRWVAWSGGLLVVLFLLEATSGSPIYLLPQALFLGWTAAVGVQMSRRPSPQSQLHSELSAP